MRERPDRGRLLYTAVLLLHLALLWTLPFFPSQDGPSHLYSTLILQDLLNGGAVYGRFFDLHLSFVPNLGATVPLYVLVSVLPPLAAEKAFLSAFCLLVAGVMPRLARMTGGHPYPASFLVFPLFVSGLTVPGFYSLMMGAALWLWALWATWRTRDQPLLQRWLVSTAFSATLFACHFIAFAAYALALMCMVPTLPGRTRETTPRDRLRAVSVLMVLPLALSGWYALALARGAGAESATGAHGLAFLLQTSLDPVANAAALLNLLMFGLAPGFGWLGWTLTVVVVWLLVRPGTRPSWRGVGAPDDEARVGLDARRWLGVLTAGLIATMLLVPNVIGQLTVIKGRFPPLIAFLVPALVSAATPLAPLRRIVLTIALVASAVNAVAVGRAASRVDAYVTGAQTADVRGQIVAGYQMAPGALLDDPLLHATSYYCALLRCVDVGNYQAHSRQFLVRFKLLASLEPLPGFEHEPTRIDWERYGGVAFLIGWRLEPAERNRIATTFTLRQDSGDVSLWQRRSRAAGLTSADIAGPRGTAGASGP